VLDLNKAAFNCIFDNIDDCNEKRHASEKTSRDNPAYDRYIIIGCMYTKYFCVFL